MTPDLAESAPTPSTVDDGIPFGERLRQLALAKPNLIALTMVSETGVDRSFTLEAVDRGANQWARMLAGRGAHLGALVGIAIPNSVEFILAALGCWKIGAVPVPMRWDLPDWERTRLLQTLGAAVVLDGDNREELVADAMSRTHAPLPGRCPQCRTGSAAVVPRACRRSSSTPGPRNGRRRSVSPSRRIGRRCRGLRPSSCPVRCITPTGSIRCYTCWAETDWWCSRSSAQQLFSTQSSAIA